MHQRLGPGSKVIWFGSWVNGTARSVSDIDLAIAAPEGINYRDYAYLTNWIEEKLPTLYSVDLVNMGEVSASSQQKILAEGKRV